MYLCNYNKQGISSIYRVNVSTNGLFCTTTDRRRRFYRARIELSKLWTSILQRTTPVPSRNVQDRRFNKDCVTRVYDDA